MVFAGVVKILVRRFSCADSRARDCSLLLWMLVVPTFVSNAVSSSWRQEHIYDLAANDGRNVAASVLRESQYPEEWYPVGRELQEIVTTYGRSRSRGNLYSLFKVIAFWSPIR